MRSGKLKRAGFGLSDSLTLDHTKYAIRSCSLAKAQSSEESSDGC